MQKDTSTAKKRTPPETPAVMTKPGKKRWNQISQSLRDSVQVIDSTKATAVLPKF